MKKAVKKKKKKRAGRRWELCWLVFHTPLILSQPTHKTCTQFSSSRYFNRTDTMPDEETMTFWNVSLKLKRYILAGQDEEID
jgi:hypothetical protein